MTAMIAIVVAAGCGQVRGGCKTGNNTGELDYVC